MENIDFFGIHLKRLKTAKPRAQGGYGLTQLDPDDRTTIQNFLELAQQRSDKVALVELPKKGPRTKVRQLIQKIMGRPLSRGEYTIELEYKLKTVRSYNIIIIDNAERLHRDSFMWICSNMRSIADVFVLVVRDNDAFMKSVVEKTEVMWTLGRAIKIDLLQMVDPEQGSTL